MSHRPAARRIAPDAVRALSAADPVLADIIERVGPFEPFFEPDPWWGLVDAIASQQLSIKAAATIVGRVERLGSDRRPTPAEILELPDEALRACGLSRAKTLYVKDLARHFLEGSISTARLSHASDEEVVELVTAVRGIGRWTAHMLLIFTLDRPDVLPTDDLGLRTAVRNAYSLPDRPERAQLERIAAPWKPYRSAASLYLWRSLK